MYIPSSAFVAPCAMFATGIGGGGKCEGGGVAWR